MPVVMLPNDESQIFDKRNNVPQLQLISVRLWAAEKLKWCMFEFSVQRKSLTGLYSNSQPLSHCCGV